MEKCILSASLAWQFLNIIQYQHVNALIEIDEIIGFVLTAWICELDHKKMGWQIKHLQLWMLFFHAPSDGIYKMRFTAPRRTEHKKRIESLSRIQRYSLTYRTCKFITLTFNKCVKSVSDMKLWVQFISLRYVKVWRSIRVWARFPIDHIWFVCWLYYDSILWTLNNRDAITKVDFLSKYPF